MAAAKKKKRLAPDHPSPPSWQEPLDGPSTVHFTLENTAFEQKISGFLASMDEIFHPITGYDRYFLVLAPPHPPPHPSCHHKIQEPSSSGRRAEAREQAGSQCARSRSLKKTVVGGGRRSGGRLAAGSGSFWAAAFCFIAQHS